MGTLCQCMSIIRLVSLDWRSDRYSMVAHSVRTAAKADNFDELVVGLMHEVYGGSSYARGLFSCDVSGASALKPTLELFVPPYRKLRLKSCEEPDDAFLLGCNRPQGISASALSDWMMEETKWSERYRRWLDRFKENETARKVMIYDLEDKLWVLLNPDACSSGIPNYALPWKKHYCIDVRSGSFSMSHQVPEDDDAMLLRPPTAMERIHLIEKYSRGLLHLRKNGFSSASSGDDYSPEEKNKQREMLYQWLGEIATDDLMEEDYYSEDE
ncbi:MAG: hypothetical protein IJM00_03710 [Bacteroidales bacterium]|nr:hypothetical protein [Bacteroidales bacterium]